MKFKKSALIALCVAAGFSSIAIARTLPAPHSFALPVLFGSKKQAQAPMPQVYQIHDDATFDPVKKTTDIIPFNQSDLEFSIDLPNDWTADEIVQDSQQALSQKILGDIARFNSPLIGTSTASISIQVMRPEHEISARNWLKNYILTSGYAPDGDVKEESLTSAKASYIATVDGRSTYIYASALMNGGAVLLAQFKTTLTMKDFIAYLRAKTIDSFKLINPKEEPVEQQKIFTVADAIKFEYPGSWEITGNDFRNMNKMVVRISNKNASGLLEGLIQFVAVRRNRSSNLMTEVDALKDYLTTDLKLNLVKLLSSDKLKVYDRFAFNRYEVYDVKGQNQSLQELHFAVLGDREWYIFAFLITQKEADNLYTWARNTRSFQQVVESVR